jgi:hypothetical protein
MIAPLKRPLRFEALPQATLPPRERESARDGDLALLIGAAGFFCLLPYPALAVGGTSALQIGNALTLLLVLPVVAMSWKGRAFWIYPVLLLPLFVSALKVGVAGGDELGISVKGTAVWAVSMLALLVPQLYGRRYAVPFLTGAALATLVHAIVGVWQVYSFSNGLFPFPQLYVNQSFLSVQDNAQIIAKYTQRPFGVFPEPSAMSSSLAPWILFFVAELCGIVRLKRRPEKWQHVLFAGAAVGGLGLIILSQSGHAAVTVAAVLVMAAIWFSRSAATLRTYGVVVIGLGILLPAVIWFAALSLSNRVGGSEMGNSSWAERTSSLRIGWSILVHGDAASAICGVGVGQMAPALWNAASIDAVFSVLLTYIYETGLVGALAVGTVAYVLLRSWKRMAYGVAFGVIAGVWLVGITLTTSYEQLLSLWLVLGWLTAWPEFCDVTAVSPAPAEVQTKPDVRINEPGVVVTGPSGQLVKRWTDQ